MVIRKRRNTSSSVFIVFSVRALLLFFVSATFFWARIRALCSTQLFTSSRFEALAHIGCTRSIRAWCDRTVSRDDIWAQPCCGKAQQNVRHFPIFPQVRQRRAMHGDQYGKDGGNELSLLMLAHVQ